MPQHIADAREIGLGCPEPQLRLVPPRMQTGDAGRIFQNTATLFGLSVDDLADLALPHEGRRPRAGGVIFKQDFDVARARVPTIDAVSRARLAFDTARHFQRVAIVELGRRAAIAVVEEDRHFRHVAAGASIGAGKDHVVHRRAAHGFVRGFPHHPAQRFKQVGLAAPIRADDAGQASADHKFGRLDERFKAQQSQLVDLHGWSPHSRPVWVSPRRPPKLQ